jgi:hypothetical protein
MATAPDAEPAEPILCLQPEFVGIFFSRATYRANIGFAMAVTELNPAVHSASAFRTRASSGECIPD